MTKALGTVLSAVNRRQRNTTTHVLLYHSTFSVVPREIRRNLHNVTPDVLYQQLHWLKQHFDIVDVDHLFAHEHVDSGKVAITFDDAYQSVFTEGLQVIETLNVPCTIFVNGASLEKQPFWRDKSRYLINQSLVDDFLEYCRPFATQHNLATDNFYRATKQPGVNSAEFNDIIDGYLETKGVQPGELEYCVNDNAMLKTHPLVTYGNHSYHHYVLSSLTPEQQDEEIGRNHRLLQSLGIKLSEVFSVPFGGDSDLNDHTISTLKKYDYRGFLYSRGALNVHRAGRPQRLNGVLYRERYMVRTTFVSFQRQIFRLRLKSMGSST